MFNLLIKYNGWANGKDSISLSRVLEFTDDSISEKFKLEGQIDFGNLIKYPTIFAEESFDSGKQIVRVGVITSAKVHSDEVQIEYAFDSRVKIFSNQHLENIASELNIMDFEFSRTHWSVKDVDLYKVLLLNNSSERVKPKVFNINELEIVDPNLVSVMMPFDQKYEQIYQAIKNSCGSMKLSCNRADDIWKNDSIIQDIVSLIDSSRIVIADCTSRNPNVFYEIGISHALGRDVILITQNIDDIPFDLRHLRVITYLNNGEGLAELSEKIQKRISQILDN